MILLYTLGKYIKVTTMWSYKNKKSPLQDHYVVLRNLKNKAIAPLCGPSRTTMWSYGNRNWRNHMLQLPVGINVDALQEWEEYREEKGKPLSRLARKKVINRLAKHPDHIQQQMVDRAIENDWQGLHDLPQEQQQQSTRQVSIHQDLTDTTWAH